MKKIFRFIGFMFFWIFYVMLTLKDRNLYLMAQNRGMECTDVRSSGPFSDTYYFNRNKPPQERNFLNWKEFRKRYNF